MKQLLVVLLFVGAADLALAAPEEARLLAVPNYSFDPVLDGEPQLDPRQRAVLGGGQLHLVQLRGKVSEERLLALRANGARTLQYYPHDSYLVWMESTRAAQVESLPFVRWRGLVHPAYKVSPGLAGRSGRLNQVDVMFYDDGFKEATLNALRSLGAEVRNVYPSQPDRSFWNALVELDASKIWDVAQLDSVLWMGYQSPQPIHDDEMSAQIVAGNHTGGTPQTGYLAHLTSLNVDGSGVIWSITDSGVDYDHPDLAPRIVGGHSYPGCMTTNPGDSTNSGHGTHAAGIAMGDAAAGFSDDSGFLYGLGMAPEASIFAQNPICPSADSWPPAGGWQELSKQGVLGNAVGTNNSWTSGEGTRHGYQATERTHDFMVRDGNFDTPGVAEPYIVVFSAGNSGNSGLTSPKEAKNVIVVANSLNFRAGSIDAISNGSSRGPAVDGRQVPTVAAPGSTIASARADGGGSCTSSVVSDTNNLYSFCSGTSMAAPHVAGAVILVTQWWRELTGSDPSPAMAKALLVNNAIDMSTADRWNEREGWGRADVTRIIDPGVQVFRKDQELTFDSSGEQYQITLPVDDPSQPVRITLGWSDAPAAVGANPALVNDLDLEVASGGEVYLGNAFANGWSVTGGVKDARNNLENVFIREPGSSVTVVVEASAINGDGVPFSGDSTDQDFVLVCSNCRNTPAIFVDRFETGGLGNWPHLVP